jgi:hypothetical protein
MGRIKVSCTINFQNIQADKQLEGTTTIIVIASQELSLSF